MTVAATFTFQVSSLNGGYRGALVTSTPLGYWQLGEGSGTVAVDILATNNGTYVGSPTLGIAAIWDASGNSAVTFDGVNDTVTMGDVAAFRFTGAFSVVFWFKTTTGGAVNGSGLVTKAEASGVGFAGWLVQETSGGQIQFFAATAAEVAVFNITTTLAYNDGLWHHVACTWDGTTTANKVIIYVDGTSVKTGTAVAGTIGTGTYPFRLGARGNTAADFYTGTLDEPAVFGSALSAATITTLASYANDWINSYNPDWSGATPTQIKRGMADNVPTTRVAAVGTAEWDLINSARNIGGVVGFYSPDSANFNADMVFGKRVRWLATYAGVDYPLFSGRIRSLLPDSGTHSAMLTHATAHDAMGDLALFELHEVTPQVSKTETDLISTIALAVPSAVQPQVLLDSAKETYPYALDDIGGGAGNGLAVLHNVVISAWGLCWVNVYNAIKYRNRTTQAAKTATATLTDADTEDLVILGSRDRIYNRIRVTVRPAFVDTAATTVLCDGAGMLIPHNSTVEFFLTYRDPTVENKLIGGTAQVTPLTTPAHYLANANADGSGANLTANISIVTTAFAAAAKFAITNSGGTDAYMTLLQLLGKGIYRDNPVTFEDSSTIAFYDNMLDVDMPYVASGLIPGGGGGNLAESTAFNLAGALGTVSFSEVAFNPQKSSTLMGYALTMDIGDIVTITETVTGVTAVDAMIVGIAHEITPGPTLRTRWTIALNIPTAW